MEIPQLQDLEIKNGKVDYKDLIGAAETWVADLTNKSKEVKTLKNIKKSVLVGIELFSLFFGFKDLET